MAIITRDDAECPYCGSMMAWADYLQAFKCALCSEPHLLAPYDIYLEWNQYWLAETNATGQIVDSARLVIVTVEQ